MNQVTRCLLTASQKKCLRNPAFIAKKPRFLKISSFEKILSDSEKPQNFGLETSKY